MSELFKPIASDADPNDTLNSSIPLKRDTLSQFFIDGCKDEHDRQIGVEWEKLGVYKDSGKAISYYGKSGVESIFSELIKEFHWQPIYSGQFVIALTKNTSSITLEPGGQIELSGHKALTISENASELYDHLSEIKEVSAKLGIVWLGLGAHPVSPLDEIEWVPKERYKIMRETLPGKLTHHMMKKTASIQISLDYTSEKDAIEKLRLAMALSPFLSAMYGNSPFSEGKLNGFKSWRAEIWQDTAPERSGIIQEVFKSGFSFESYVQFALKVPMIFIVRGNRWIPMNGMTFEDYLESGYAGTTATGADWELHLTTLFTEARLKKYIEIRSIDCQKTGTGLSIPALMKGLFYDDQAQENAWKIVGDLTLEERLEITRNVPRKGLRTAFKGHTLLRPCLDLLHSAQQGLLRISERTAGEREIAYLTPLKEALENGQSPADLLIEKAGASFESLSEKERVKKILEWTEI
jgi:glutamate--cysteine ligase